VAALAVLGVGVGLACLGTRFVAAVCPNATATAASARSQHRPDAEKIVALLEKVGAILTANRSYNRELVKDRMTAPAGGPRVH